MFVDPDGRFVSLVPVIVHTIRVGAPYAVRAAAPVVVSVVRSCLKRAFKKGGILDRTLNRGPNRLGISRHENRTVFRGAGPIVEKFNRFRGRPDRGNKIIDFDLGPR